MITKKSTAEIDALRAGGKLLAKVLDELAQLAVPGNSTQDIDDRAMELCEGLGLEPALLGYHPGFAAAPYPAATCLSVNNTVQHGIPSESVVLQEGDVIDIDVTLGYNDMIVDAGRTVGVGNIAPDARKLLAVTEEALSKGIKAAQPGGRVGDISHAIQTHVEGNGLSVVEALCGHGVGYAVHEEPTIPNFGKPGTGPKIEVGHVYAIEPIVNLGRPDVYFDDAGDGYSVYTKDGSWSAHFEHTVAITESGPLILTKR